MLLLDLNASLSDLSFNLLNQHLIRLGIWAITSCLLGLIILWQKWSNPFWQNFGLQFTVWGLIDGIIVIFGLHNQTQPDFLALVKLREFLWLNEGLDVGYLAVGVTLILVGKAIKESPRILGAGYAVAIQGFILLVLDTVLLLQLPIVSQWLTKY